jgi:2,4'-dihydroxyacetophenone dioxygenase
MTVVDAASALHRSEQDVPFVDFRDGSHVQLTQVDLGVGLWVLRIRLEPGTTLLRHRHTGPVFAFTVSGRWHYREYDDVNTAGSYLYEPANSVHTLQTPADSTEITEVCFAIFGANLNLDDDDNIVSIADAASVLRLYRHFARKQGFPEPQVIVSG